MVTQLSYWVLPVADVETAVAFFADALGWEFSEPGSAGGRHVLRSDPQGGLAPASAAVGRLRPSLAFQPDDLDAAIDRIRALGGSASERPESSGHGRWVECTDAQGTAFALYAPTGE